MDPLNQLFLSLIDNETTELNISTDSTHISILGQDDPEVAEQPGPQTSHLAPAELPSTKRIRSTTAKVPPISLFLSFNIIRKYSHP